MDEQPLVGRRERKKHDVEQRLLRAARDLFREHGYEGTTVEQIAERADVAKGTFFNYFPRKDAILISLSEALFDELDAEMGPPGQWEGTALTQVRRLYLCLARLVEADRQLSRVILMETLRTFWLRTSADPLEERFNALCRGALARGVERGEFLEPPDLTLATKLLGAAWFTALLEWLREGEPSGDFGEELSARLVVLFRGFGAREFTAGHGVVAKRRGSA